MFAGDRLDCFLGLFEAAVQMLSDQLDRGNFPVLLKSL